MAERRVVMLQLSRELLLVVLAQDGRSMSEACIRRVWALPTLLVGYDNVVV